MKITNKYDDIIHLSHHVSKTRPQMSIHDRAAQFAPFAALTGHSAAIKETERLNTPHTFFSKFHLIGKHFLIKTERKPSKNSNFSHTQLSKYQHHT